MKKLSLNQTDLDSLGDEFKVSAMVVVQKGDDLTINGIGEVGCYLVRDNKLGRIFEGKKRTSTIRGRIKNNDRFVLLTAKLEETIGIGNIRNFLNEGVEGVEKLAVLIHEKEDSSELAAIVAKVTQVKEQEVQRHEYSKILKTVDWQGKVSGIISKFNWQRPLFIQEEKRRWNLAVGTVLIFLLIIGVASGMLRRSKILKDHAYNQMDSVVGAKMSEAKSIADLNPERAKTLIQEGKNEIGIYLEETKDEKYTVRAKALEEELNKLETEVFKKQQVSLSTFTELELIKNDLTSNSLYLDSQGNILIAAENSPFVASMNITDKSTLEVDLGEYGRAKELATYNKTTFAIVDRGILEITKGEKKLVIEPDELWKDVRMMDVFGGNVYLFDKGESEIWKYPALTDSFGTRRRWLGAGIQLDLSNVVDMKVDGDLWLITSTGKLERYSRGVPVEFSMEGFPAYQGDKLSDPKAIFITEDKVFVLEGGAGRVAVFNKESGKYERQYANDDLKNGRDMVVFKDKAYVLIGDKIVWFQL